MAKKYRGKVQISFEALKDMLGIEGADIFNIIKTERDEVSDTVTILLKSDGPSDYTYEVAETQMYPDIHLKIPGRRCKTCCAECKDYDTCKDNCMLEEKYGFNQAKCKVCNLNPNRKTK
jgi:hypothetical protein